MPTVTAVAERTEVPVQTDLSYRPGDPVVVHVIHRGPKTDVTDHGAAAERAGLPRGWREVAKRVDRELNVNISRHGVVSLPVVTVGPGEQAIIRRIAEASLALYEELLELEAG